jgi:hypothetical protein
MGQADSIGYAEAENIEHVAVLIGHFHAPGAFVCFSQLYDAVGGPFGRIKPESGLGAELTPVKPAMVDQSGLGDGIKRGKTADLAGGYRKCNRSPYGCEVFNLLTHGCLIQYQLLKGMIGRSILFGEF